MFRLGIVVRIQFREKMFGVGILITTKLCSNNRLSSVCCEKGSVVAQSRHRIDSRCTASRNVAGQHGHRC
jgi:hypothetical protein